MEENIIKGINQAIKKTNEKWKEKIEELINNIKKGCKKDILPSALNCPVCGEDGSLCYECEEIIDKLKQLKKEMS